MKNFLPVLIIGSIMCWEAYCLNGRPPNYSQDQMPITSFSCRDKILGGYYADPETHCQMFHVCVKVPGLGVQDYKFLCPNDTSFDQENQICDDWYNIDCEASTLFYSDNFDLYRIGSESGREAIRNAPRLPSNNVNNAVSDVDDDNYLQRSDRGENVGSDLLRGSHSSNFFSNKYRGREEEDLKEELNKKKKAGNNKNQVRKLLTGKRPVTPSPQVAYQDNSQNQQSSQQPRVNAVARNRGASNFQRTQQSPATEAPQRQTEVYNNNQRPSFNNNNNYNNQRNFYTPTTPKTETIATQRNDYFKNNFYNPVTQQTARPNFYNGAQNNYNSPSTYAPPTNTNFVTNAPNRFTQNYQTTRSYPTYSPTSTVTPVSYSSPAPSAALPADRVNHYETQKLYKLNTAAFQQAQNQDQYDDSKDDEFLKTAHSQNLGASNFNRVQNSLKQWNATLSANYNFQQAATSVKPSPAYQQNYSPTTIRPSSQYYQPQNTNNQQNTAYTPSSTVKPYEPPKNNFFTPTTTLKPVQSISSTTLRPYSPVQQQSTYFSPSTTQRPYQQTQNNYYTPSTTQRTTYAQSNTANTGFPANNAQNNFFTATSPPQNTYQQRNFYQQPSSPSTYQQQNNFRSQTPTVKPYQDTAKPQQTPVQQKSRSRGSALYSHTTDATENPRPFTVPSTSKHPETKDKDQYDYAYYDDGTQGSEYDVDTVDFARTKSKSRS